MKVGDRVRTVTHREIVEEELPWSASARIEETTSGMLNEPYGTVIAVQNMSNLGPPMAAVKWDVDLPGDPDVWNSKYLRVVCKAEILEPAKPVCVCPSLWSTGHEPNCHEIKNGTYAERARRGW